MRGGGGWHHQRLHGVQAEVLQPAGGRGGGQEEEEGGAGQYSTVQYNTGQYSTVQVEARRRRKVELVQEAGAWGQGIESLLPV